MKIGQKYNLVFKKYDLSSKWLDYYNCNQSLQLLATWSVLMKKPCVLTNNQVWNSVKAVKKIK